MQIASDPKAVQYYYNMRAVSLVSDYAYAYLDGKRFALSQAPKAAGMDVLVAAEDLEKLFAPDMVFLPGKGGGEFVMEGIRVEVTAGSREIRRDGAWIVLANGVEYEDGVLYVPAGQMMSRGFDKKMISSQDPATPVDPMSWPQSNTLVTISHDAKYSRDNAAARNIHIQMRGGKTYGEQRESYWMEEARKVVPYNLYIPSSYSPERPSRLLVALHGGRVCEEFIFEKTANRIQYYCEKYNYILLCPNACIMDCTYGCLIPNYQFLENSNPCRENRENPMQYSKEVIELMKLGEKDVLNVIGLVKKAYSIDEEHIYMLGNSMGGIGTFHFAASYPGLLRAIAPAGGCPHMDYFRPERLGDIPIHFVYGSEDDWGSDYLDYACEKLREAGCNLEVDIIGGGHHGDSWVTGLEGIFEFFNKH